MLAKLGTRSPIRPRQLTFRLSAPCRLILLGEHAFNGIQTYHHSYFPISILSGIDERKTGKYISLVRLLAYASPYGPLSTSPNNNFVWLSYSRISSCFIPHSTVVRYTSISFIGYFIFCQIPIFWFTGRRNIWVESIVIFQVEEKPDARKDYF